MWALVSEAHFSSISTSMALTIRVRKFSRAKGRDSDKGAGTPRTEGFADFDVVR
jgi:hypothetical protein